MNDMDENERLLRSGSSGASSMGTLGHPWMMKVFETVQGYLQSDKARFHILKTMVDGEWHNLTSLLRIAKKDRPIGMVGVGMALNALQANIGMEIFENNASHETQGSDLVDSSWKIKDEYMGIFRAVITSMDGGVSTLDQANQLNSTLERIEIQKANRTASNDPDLDTVD
jgi:hypothetical protein